MHCSALICYSFRTNTNISRWSDRRHPYHAHTHTHTSIHTHTHTLTFTCTHTRTHTRTHTHTHSHSHVHTLTHTFTHTQLAHTCTHIHTTVVDINFGIFCLIFCTQTGRNFDFTAFPMKTKWRLFWVQKTRQKIPKLISTTVVGMRLHAHTCTRTCTHTYSYTHKHTYTHTSTHTN